MHSHSDRTNVFLPRRITPSRFSGLIITHERKRATCCRASWGPRRMPAGLTPGNRGYVIMWLWFPMPDPGHRECGSG